MQKYLLPVVSFCLVDAKAPQNEVSHLRTANVFRDDDLSGVYFLLEAIKGPHFEIPGDLAHHHLVSHNSKRPYVTLIGVDFLIENLWRHVGGSAHLRLEEAVVFRVLGQSEISYLQHIVLDEDVFRLEISMDDPVFNQFSEAIQNLYQILHHPLLLESCGLLDDPP